MKNRLSSASLTIALVIVAVLLLGVRTTNYFPVIEIQTPSAVPSAGTASGQSAVMLRFLFSARSGIERCEALTGNIARTTLSSCPGCVVRNVQCLDTLDSTHDQILSGASLPYPSGSMANGAIVFIANDQALARAACAETQRQSIGSINPVTCYPPGATRPAIPSLESGVEPMKLARLLAGMLAALAALGAAYHTLTGRTFRELATQPSRKLATWLESLPRNGKQVVMLISDSVGLILSLWLAFSARLEVFYVPPPQQYWLFLIPPLIAVPIFVRLGLYRAVVRFIGVQAIWAIIRAVALYSFLLAPIFLLSDTTGIPRSVYLLNLLFAGIMVGLSRLIAREWFGRIQAGAQKSPNNRKPVAIYGAGSAGIQLAMALASSREMRPVAFFDDDEQIHGRQIAGINVHPSSAIGKVVQQQQIRDVLLAIPSVSRAQRQQIIQMLETYSLRVQTLPGLAELADGQVQIADLREVDVEDLLGRKPVPAKPELLDRNIKSKVVMVTGAGGSIGSELCRQICALGAKTLLLYEQSEFNLYTIEQELQQLSVRPTIVPLLGSVLDQARLEHAMTSFGVHTVFHAAAYKHVPMVEKNPVQGVTNNIFGTWHAANAAVACEVETFVLISTDKAVRPTNTMGATKRFAEMALQSLHARASERTRFTMVRFGNVLGSSGSVIPLFRQQIKNGGPVTVTDPRIIRYFMTIPEAAELVIQAGAMGQGGDVFVLDMGEPVKILDLAKRKIHLSGLRVKDEANPNGDIEIVFTGLRPGEKLYEELLIGDNVVPTDHPRIMRANENCIAEADLDTLLAALKKACDAADSEEVRRLLRRGVIEFSPQCGNEDLLKGSEIVHANVTPIRL